ncbi:MAG: PAS domain-containing sensor histidine kinase [bacterium]
MDEASPQALQRAHLAAVVDGSLDAIIATDPQGRIEAWNPAARRMFGYASEEIIGRPASVLVPEDRHEELARFQQKIRAGQPVERLETVRVDRQGRRFEVSVTFSPIRDELDRLFGISTIERDISERRRMENELRASEQRFRATFEQAAVGICHNAPDGRWLRVNPRFCEILATPHDELLRQSFQELTHPEDLEADLALMKRALAGEIDHYALEKRYRRKDGSWVWASLHVSLVRDDRGRPDYFVGILQDVAARKRAEEEARASEQTLRTILDSLPIGVWFSDAEGRVVYGNRAGIRVWGGRAFGSFKELGAYKGWRADTGRIIEPQEWPLARALRGETCLNERVEIEGFDGVRRSVLNSALPLRTEDGHIRGAVAMLEDVTPREETEAAVRATRERLAAVVDHASEAILSLDAEGRIESFNPAAERIFGYDAGEVLGRGVSMLMPSPHREEHARYMTDSRQKRDSRILGVTRELQGLRKDGTVFPMELSVSEIEHLGSFIGIVRDISDRKDLEGRLRETDRMATIGNFAAGLCHDMDNIVSPMLIRLSLLEDSSLDEEETHESIQALRLCADALAELTRAMRGLVRGDDGSERSGVDLASWWEELKSLLHVALSPGVELVSEMPADLPPIAARRGQLTRAVLNLVVNADEAISRANGGTGRIVVSAEAGPSEAEIRLCVRDDGPGMPPEIRGRIFEPLFSTKSAPATGLGLPMVLAFVEEVGGSIEVESEPGRGSEFILRLPTIEARLSIPHGSDLLERPTPTS